MSFSDCHSFHDCPLRTSSLLIVSKEKQTIVTATDEVFDLLGYDPIELVGRSINLLDPRQYYDNERKERFTLCHATSGHLPFEICIHHDPLTNATDLDYWLIRPVNTLRRKTSSPFTILRLSPFGTIEHAYPSTQFPQQTPQLKGHPIMSFVHESDVRSMCEKLCHLRRRRTHHTFRVRWLRQFHPKEAHTDQDFEWVSLTVMNAPRRSSCDAANDPQSRPICIIRPDQEQQVETSCSGFSTPYLLTGLVSGTLRLLWEGTSVGFSSLFELVEGMHTALDQGKIYMIEYFAHLLTHALNVANELLYFSESKKEEEMVYMKHQYKIEEHASLLEDKKKKSQFYGLSTVKVAVENNIWSVPLYTKASNYLTDKSSFRNRTNNKQTN
ncbi:hypothetical protein INT47_009326 [Mucor saturninus]|uniref:PAS domain-containing protein n=1 Tax=Mucor saturninus TaxID=64648 RepID=A0A8H7QPM6_9FUNG|nr:hypothetical protein INT47_009326 [Mucor saturninus]